MEHFRKLSSLRNVLAHLASHTRRTKSAKPRSATAGLVSADALPPVLLGGGTVPEKGRRQLKALDGIRGVAVLAVMLAHFNRFLPWVGVLVPFKVLVTYGVIGVDLFFVLSGFLITGILLETKAAVNYFTAFYARRFLRIFPIYYATLAVIFSVAALYPSIPNVPPPGQRWLYFVYLCNWIPFWTHSWPPNVVGHFWSLAVEEQFYLVWPVCVLFLSARGLFKAAVGISLGSLLLRCVWVWHSGATSALLLGTLTRMDTLLIGAIAALMYQRVGRLAPPRSLNRIAVVALSLFAAGIVIATWHRDTQAAFGFIGGVGYTLLAIGFAALVLGAALGEGKRNSVQRFFSWPLLRRVGKYSYGMYVYHVPILGLLQLVVLSRLPLALTGNPYFAVAYYTMLFVVTFAFAAASYEFVERRILALKGHFEPAFHPQDAALLRAEGGPGS